MVAVSVGWKLIGISFATGLAALVLGAFAFTMDSSRTRVLRRASVVLLVLAVITVIIVVIVGPGEWCGPGDAYEVPGCA